MVFLGRCQDGRLGHCCVRYAAVEEGEQGLLRGV